MTGGIFIGDYTAPNTKYQTSVWLKATEELTYALSVELETAPGEYTYEQLDRKTISPKDGWVELKGTFNSGDAMGVVAFIDASKSKTVFYVDDISHLAQQNSQVRVKSDGSVNIRSEGSMSGRIIGKAQNGDVFTSTGRADSGWYIVEMKDGQIGYISDTFIVPVD